MSLSTSPQLSWQAPPSWSSTISSPMPSASGLSTPTASSPPPYASPSPAPGETKTIRSKSLWFADGNLIIHAPPVQFKVYAGILAARSAVFNDMLSFPPPPEGNEVVDGCVVVRLFGDDPGEVRWFLKAILDSSFFEPPPTPTTLPIIRAILRLSRKYSVPYLYTRALAHLHSTFPTTLQAWRARDTTRTIPPIDNTPFVTLQLAREFGLDWIVPSVVYCICSHPLEKTQKGAIWDPPKEAGEEWVREEKGKGEEEEGEGKTVLLDGDDRDMAVSCRIELMLMQNRAGVEMAVRAHSGEHCLCLVKPAITNDAVAPAPAGAAGLPPGFQPVGPQTPNPPANNANAIANQLQLHFPTIPAPVPLAPLTNLAPNTCPLTRLRCMEIISSWDVVGFLDFHADNRPVFVGGLCPPCREVFKRECERLAGEMWDALPRLCGLEGWDVLESKRRGAVSF